MRTFIITIAVGVIGLLFLAGCGGGDGSGLGGGAGSESPGTAHHWTWGSGSSTAGAPGVYGTRGVADAANVPGARRRAAAWSIPSGTLWLFGGIGLDANGELRYLNDLWKFDGTAWTWVSGANIGTVPASPGIYGQKGVSDSLNIPGGRQGAVAWTDSSGNLWLFGGIGLDSAGAYGRLNDLWKFDGTAWTWMAGSDTTEPPGVYGTYRVANAVNTPGGREAAIGAVDGSGNLWLFGGYGRDSAGVEGYMNDLWRFDGTNWTWMSGSTTNGQLGTYGTMGVATAVNVPGARTLATGWSDAAHGFKIYGGKYMFSQEAPETINFNDFWTFDGTNWVWISGTSGRNHGGVFGVKGVASAANMPPAMSASASWTDMSGNYWMFGGEYQDEVVSGQYYNALWKWDGTAWTWMSGGNTRNESGVYGTRGVADAANVPGARAEAVSWRDAAGDLWLFGGINAGAPPEAQGLMNDLWKYEP